MHSNIPYMFDCWAVTVVDPLPLKRSMVQDLLPPFQSKKVNSLNKKFHLWLKDAARAVTE